MKRLAAVAGCVLPACFAYVAGVKIGHSMGREASDWEWARMLENGMVGPGTTSRPTASVAASSLQIVGSV